MDAGVAPTIPAFSTVMACSTSMVGAIEAAGMINGVNRNLALVGGVETLVLSPWVLANLLRTGSAGCGCAIIGARRSLASRR